MHAFYQLWVFGDVENVEEGGKVWGSLAKQQYERFESK